jgi:hypothetical protein
MMIESLVISIVMIILTIFEFCKLSKYMSLDYNVLEQETLAFASLAEENNEKQNRREMLKKIMQ